jgi:hypothetical protein
MNYFDRAWLLNLGLDEKEAERFLRLSYLTGHAKQPVIEAEQLADLLEMLRREGGNQ